MELWRLGARKRAPREVETSARPSYGRADAKGTSDRGSMNRTLAKLGAVEKSADLARGGLSVTAQCDTRVNTNIGGIFAIVHGLLLA